ncbi:MAG: restriction endonuclease [Bacteroidia bacterium]
MIIDFTEIPVSNSRANTQDIFEKFAREFLLTLGYEIVTDPARGQDGGIDIKVKEIRPGISGNTEVVWLVSCKHYAHSGKSITAEIEQNILDRVKSKGCSGFIGIYSSIANTSLQKRLDELRVQNELQFQLFDNEKIERELISVSNRSALFARFFPNSFQKWKDLYFSDGVHKREHSHKTRLKEITEEDLFQAALSANVILELEIIKDEFFETDWSNRDEILNKLNRYSELTNSRISKEVLGFLLKIAGLTRGRMPVSMSFSIFLHVLNFFPSSVTEEELPSAIHMADTCISIGFAMSYDATIHRDNFVIAGFGLLIAKRAYTFAMHYDLSDLKKKVQNMYDRLELTLQRPERSDLGDALRLTKCYRNDLQTARLEAPDLPADLLKKMDDDEYEL